MASKLDDLIDKDDNSKRGGESERYILLVDFVISIYRFSVHVPYIRVDRNQVEVYLTTTVIFRFIHLFIAQSYKARDPNASDPFAVLQHKASSQSALYIMHTFNLINVHKFSDSTLPHFNLPSGN